MSSLIESRDLKEAIKMAYEFLDNTNDRLEEEVADIVLANDGRNRDAEDFEKHFEVAITYIDLYNRDKNRRSVFDSDRDMEEAVGKSLTLAVAAMVAADKELNADLSDRDYDDVIENAEKIEKMADALEDLEREQEDRGRSRSRSRGRDDRDSRRSGSRSRSRSRSRDRDTGRSRTSTQYRRTDDRYEQDDRESRRSARREEKRESRKPRSQYGRNTGRREEEEVVETRHAVNPDEIQISVPRQTPIKQSMVKAQTLPNDAASQVFNPTTHGAFAIANDAGIYRAVLSYEEENGVESYEAHELNRSLVGHDRKGERVVPLADFRTIKDPSDDIPEEGESPREPSIVYGEQLSCVTVSERIPTHVLTDVLNADAEYQVVRMNKYTPLTVVKSVVDTVNADIGEISNMKRFNDFYNWITKVQDVKEDLAPRNERFAMLGCLNELISQLTRLANNLFGIISNIPGMSNFLEDWPNAQAWLVNPDNADIYAAWQELEAQYLRSNLAVLNADEEKAAADKGEIELVESDSRAIENMWVRAQQFVVIVDGDITGALQLSNPNAPAKVDYELTPDFHTACMTLVQHRNRCMSMGNIILIDSVGSQYSVLANKAQVPVIKVRIL